MTSPEDFAAYLDLADDLIEQASKEQLADVARLLALNIGWYHERYGDVPQGDLLQLVRVETLGADGKRLLLHGMQNLVSALAEAMGVGEAGWEEVRHQGEARPTSVFGQPRTLRLQSGDRVTRDARRRSASPTARQRPGGH